MEAHQGSDLRLSNYYLVETRRVGQWMTDSSLTVEFFHRDLEFMGPIPAIVVGERSRGIAYYGEIAAQCFLVFDTHLIRQFNDVNHGS